MKLTRAQLSRMVAAAVAKAMAQPSVFKRKTSTPRENVYDPGGFAAASVKSAAASMVPRSGPPPTKEQVDARGGGLEGRIRATLAARRGESS